MYPKIPLYHVSTMFSVQPGSGTGAPYELSRLIGVSGSPASTRPRQYSSRRERQGLRSK
jgi:hypothetical protein